MTGTPETLLCVLVAAPGVAFLALALVWMLGVKPGEAVVTRVTQLAFGLSGLAFLWLVALVLQSGGAPVTVNLGNWFQAHEYTFPLILFADALSLPLLGLTILLTAITGAFSRTYMHREAGFFRFYLQMNLFACGSLLVLAAGSFDLMIGGWELVGISSVLLIAFFEQRTGPVRNAIRVFATYRAADVGLLVAVFLMHHWGRGATFSTLFATAMPPLHAAVIGLLLLLAASGKSAQLPFSGWLPRAMEGPTPSSAIFYGAISVHLGAYLLLRAEPILAEAPLAAAGVVLIGAMTALYGTLAGRTCSDAKTSLAFAALSQLGLIFAEIGFGWANFAMFHILGHATVRTLQFLRAPSVLADYQQLHAAAGGPLPKTGRFYDDWLPLSTRLWLYRFSLDRGHLESLIDRGFSSPLNTVSRWVGGGGRPTPRFSAHRSRAVPQPTTKTVRGIE